MSVYYAIDLIDPKGKRSVTITNILLSDNARIQRTRFANKSNQFNMHRSESNSIFF